MRSRLSRSEETSLISADVEGEGQMAVVTPIETDRRPPVQNEWENTMADGK